MRVVSGENWKRCVNHAEHIGMISPADKQKLEMVRQTHSLAGQSARKTSTGLGPNCAMLQIQKRRQVWHKT